ncbi:hypothetical_protein [Candidozyma auris]|uniref:hypothetical_protein n=1 Tax=Candidozyma auris TaxID=498019 RepID=UPI000D2DE3CA|nr:hypothetical_protein [[Candida] auris]XP_054558228.1 hypothetical_protein [[Candida] auris]QEO23901.1 hypothetical_protein [[Candida] auris]QEO23959.1 hypothetical_protein [[Candida] auris]GBL52810.1 hypothetical protein CAJCM15448_50840 [[Candida] auris]
MSAPEESFDFNSAPAKSQPAKTTPSSSSSGSLSPCYVLTWQDPVLTGKIFGGIVAGLILLKVNVISHVFYLLYLGLLVSAAAEYVGKLVTGQGFVTKYTAHAPSYSKIINESVLPAVGKFATCFEAKVQRIVYAQDIELTLKAAGVSYILYFITSFLSLYTLAFVGVLVAFSWPPFYIRNKDQIDALVAHYTKLLKQKTSELTSQAHKSVAPHLNTLAKKTGPVGDFISSKFPTRTAGSTVNASKDTSYATGSKADPVAVEKPLDGAGSAAPTAHATGSSFPSVPSAAPTGVVAEDVEPASNTGAEKATAL